MKRNGSICPANECRIPSSSRAEERTATRSPLGQSAATALSISARTYTGNWSAARIRSIAGRSEAAQEASKAGGCVSAKLAGKVAGEMTNHGGIGRCALCSAANAPALPPISRLAPLVPGWLINAAGVLSFRDNIGLASFDDQLPDERQNTQAQIDQQGPCARKCSDPFAASPSRRAQKARGNDRCHQQK